MNDLESILNELEEYERVHNLEDISAPDEAEDIELTEEEYAIVDRMGEKLPPLAPGRTVTSSMINFAHTVTKSYRLCYFQFYLYVENTIALSPDEMGYVTRKNVDHFFSHAISKRITSAAVNRRYVSALQKYAVFWEERTNFKVDSATVKKALDDAKASKNRHHKSSSTHIDAHKHRPTLHHSVQQELHMIHEAFTSVQPSKYGQLPIGVNLLI